MKPTHEDVSASLRKAADPQADAEREDAEQWAEEHAEDDDADDPDEGTLWIDGFPD
jgi:hypothetical protein